MPSTMFGLSAAWRERHKHWHAYREGDGTGLCSIDRLQRIHREPDAVLRTPDEVAEWIEARILELGSTRKVLALLDSAWMEIPNAGGLAQLFGEHVAVASRGESIYTDVDNGHQRIELFVGAVARDVCSRH